MKIILRLTSSMRHLVVACLLVTSLQAQSTYKMDSSTADYSNFGSAGGTVTVDYVLQSGSAVSGIGNSFEVVYTVSDLNLGPAAPGTADYQWLGASTENNFANSIGSEPLLDSFFNNNNANLSSNNKDGSYSFSQVIPDYESSLDGWARALLANNYLDQLGTFTVSVGNIAAPTGYAKTYDTVSWGSRFNMVVTSGDPTEVQQGVWAAPDGSSARLGRVGRSGILETTHGITQLFNYTAFDNPDNVNAIDQNGRGFWSATGSMTFEQVPEPSSCLMMMSAGVLLLIRRNRIC